jgi:putative ABC transport system permease protein
MKQQLKYFWRRMASKPAYSIITFSGFTFGILAGLLIYLWVFNELSYDKFHMDYNRIYRVLTLSKQGNEIVKSAKSYRSLTTTLKSDYPQIEYATFLSYSSEDSPLQTSEESEKIEAREVWVTNDFFSIFNGFVFTEGNVYSAINTPNCIVLSEKIAHKLFGNESALGKKVIKNKYEKEIYTVGGVLNIPKNSHIDFGYLLPECKGKSSTTQFNWSDSYWVHTYIKLKNDAQIDDTFLNRVANHISRYSKMTDKLLFQPLADIHLHSDYEPASYDQNMGNYKYVWIFSGLALLIILMAALNFSVLSVARASERSTEIGIKKANGADKFSISKQFMGESMVQTLAASIGAIVLIYFVLPVFNQLIGREIQLTWSMSLALNILLLSILTGFLAGIYPSFFMSSFKPIVIFRGGSVSGSRSRFVRFLVVGQFSIAIFFTIATFIFIKQLNFTHNKDLGLNKNNVVVIPTGLWYNNRDFKNALLKNPNIESVAASTSAPVDVGWKRNFTLNHNGVMDSLETELFFVDEDFAKTYGLQVTKGQFLQMNYDDYWKELKKSSNQKQDDEEHTASFPIVINESAEKMLGFDDPIGERIGNDVIIGVVKDFNFKTLYHPIGPLFLTNNPEAISTMSVKIRPNNRAETLKFIRHTYGKYRDKRGFSYQFFDDIIDSKYKEEKQLKNITLLFSILAIVIAIMGILGMALFSIDSRTKEIGIRKINGAKISEILTMLNKDFVKWVAIAFAIATPIAYYAMNKWLQSFTYKTELSWWIFALAGLLALGIALLTVSWQSWRAATRNPVEALRYE